MTVTVLNDCVVYVNELDLTGQSNSVEATLEADELDATVFGNGGYASIVPGNRTGTFDHGGFMEYSTTMAESLRGAMGSTNVATVGFGPAIGDLAWLMSGASFSATPLSGSVGQLAVLNGSLKSAAGSYGLRSGKLLAPKGARTSTASTTGVQLFTSGTVTLVTASVHNFLVSGTTPSSTVTVQSSATQGGSYTTRATFTAATAAGSEYVSAAISTTDQWWRATFTISGTSPSFTTAVAAAVS
jgi:hypothetical protein